MENTLIPILAALIVGILVLLVIREIVTWYWKVNEFIENQQLSNQLLARQNELLAAILNQQQQNNIQS